MNKDRKIQGISSSCIRMINMDIQKVKKMVNMGVDMTKLTPDLFDNDNNE